MIHFFIYKSIGKRTGYHIIKQQFIEFIKEQEGAGRSRQEQEGAAAISRRSSFSVGAEFGTDWIQRNPFPLYNPEPSMARPGLDRRHP